MIDSFPYPGIPTGIGDDGFLKSDRDYNDKDLAEFMSAIRPDGIINQGNNPLMVTSDGGMTVRINYGTIQITGRHGRVHTEPEYLTLDPADSQPRIDLIVMRHNYNHEFRAILPKIIKGEPSASPFAPAIIRDDKIYDMVLAKIYIPAGAVNITQDNITDTRQDENLCGMIKLLILKNDKIPAEDLPSGLGPKRLIAMFTGSGIFNADDYGLAIGDKIDVYMAGGGGGGGGGGSGASTVSGGGGGGGYCKLIKDYTLTILNNLITIGSGGAGGLGTVGNITNGSNGGNTTAFGTTVNGGSGGIAGGTSGTGSGGAGGSGGSSRNSGNSNSPWGYPGGSGGRTPLDSGRVGGLGGGTEKYQPVNPYDGIEYGCGGGGGGMNAASNGWGGGANGGKSASSSNGENAKGRGGGGAGGSGAGGYNGGNGGIGGGGGGGGGHHGTAGTNNGGTGGAGGGGIVLIYAAGDLDFDRVFTTTTTENDYAVTIPDYPGPIVGVAYKVQFQAANTSTNVTFNINGLGNVGIYMADGTTVPSVGTITANSTWIMQYTSTNRYILLQQA